MADYCTNGELDMNSAYCVFLWISFFFHTSTHVLWAVHSERFCSIVAKKRKTCHGCNSFTASTLSDSCSFVRGFCEAVSMIRSDDDDCFRDTWDEKICSRVTSGMTGRCLAADKNHKGKTMLASNLIDDSLRHIPHECRWVHQWVWGLISSQPHPYITWFPHLFSLLLHFE